MYCTLMCPVKVPSLLVTRYTQLVTCYPTLVTHDLQSTTTRHLCPAEKICSLALTALCNFCVGADNSNLSTPLVRYNTIPENFITQLVVHCHRISFSF